MSRAYGWADDGVALVESEAEVLRDAAALVLQGKSLRAVAAHLNEKNVPTVTGKPWAPIVVKRALTNPRIIGKQKVFDKLVPSEASAILTPNTFRALEKAFAKSSRASKPRRVDLLSGGIARCGLCESRLYALVTATRGGYACAARSGGCGKVWIEAPLMEQDAGEKVVAFLAGNVEELNAALARARSRVGIENELGELTARKTELSVAYAAGKLKAASFHSTMAEIDDRIDAAKARLQDEEPSDAPSWDQFTFAAWWAAASKRRQRDVLEAVLARVVVNPTEKRGRGAGLDDGRVVYEFRGDPDFPDWDQVASVLLRSPAPVPA